MLGSLANEFIKLELLRSGLAIAVAVVLFGGAFIYYKASAFFDRLAEKKKKDKDNS